MARPRVDELREALLAQRAAAEETLAKLDEVLAFSSSSHDDQPPVDVDKPSADPGLTDDDDDDDDDSLKRQPPRLARLTTLAREVHAQLQGWTETWRRVYEGDASESAEDAHEPTMNEPPPRRTMMGIGPMMGGLSMGELKQRIAVVRSAPGRPNRPEAEEAEAEEEAGARAREGKAHEAGGGLVDEASSVGRAGRGAGVVVVPMVKPAAPAPNAGGKPAWMVELAAKKKAKANAIVAELTNEVSEAEAMSANVAGRGA